MYNLYLLHLVTLCYCLFQHVRWRSHHVARNWSHWSLPLTAWLSEGLRGRTENEEACLCMPGTLHAPAACPKAVCWKMLEIVWFCYVLLIEGALALLLLLVYPNQIQSFLEREREREGYIYIYDSMEWSWLQYSNSLKLQLRVGSSTTQHLSFFSGGQLSPINKDSQKALSKEAEEAEQGRPWGILTGPWVKSGNFIFEGFSFSGNSKFSGEWCILYKWIIHVMYVNRFWG